MTNGTNTPYYNAETELLKAIEKMPHGQLVSKLRRFVKTASPDVNRDLFEIFDIEE